MQKPLFLLAIALCHALWLHAQSQMHIRHYSTNDGLSQNTVTGFMQDPNGYIWLSTWDGLEKFDNYEFRNYKSYPTDSVHLRYNRINQIMKSPKGNIWCITYDKQLYLFDRETLSFKSPFMHTAEGNCRVSRAYPQDDGILWVANEEGDLFRIDENNQAVLRIEASSRPEHGRHVYAVFHDRQGYEWALTDKGTFAHNHPAARTSQVFRFVKETDEGTFFITREGHLHQFVPGKGFSALPNPYPMKPVSGLVAAGSHQLLLPDEKKVVRYDTRQGRFSILFRETSPRTLHITHIYPANDSTLWMLDGKRVLRCTLPQAGITLLESPLPARDTFRYLHEDAFGGIWVISRQGYFYQYDGASGQLKPVISGRSHYKISGSNFFRDACRNLWAVNGTGFDKIYFTNRNYDYLESGKNIRGTFIDSQKRLWVASTDNTLRIYDAQRQLIGNVDAYGRVSAHAHAPFGRKVYCFYEDEQRRIWLGTRNNGLIILEGQPGGDFKLQAFRHDKHDAYSLSHNAIYAICRDTKGKTWVGTLGGGVNLAVDEGGRLRFHSARNTFDGYPPAASKVRSLHCTSNGTILAGTTEGLLWFADNFKDTSGITFHRLGFEDGLSSNDIMDAIEGTDGRVYLAAYGGGICSIPADSLRAGKATFRYLNMKNGLPSDLSLSLTESKDGDIWICFENYITRYDIHSQSFENYSRNNLHTDLQITEAQPATDGEGTALCIGTRNGLMRLRLPHLQTSGITPPLVFTEASIQGSNGTARPGAIHNNALSLRPRERNITVTFAALDYTNPQAIAYAYRLKGMSEQWNYIGHNRTINLTNLPAGKLTLEVKSTNGDGVWTGNATPLFLQMQPRFRETAGAKALYVLAFIALAVIVSVIINSFANLKRGIRLEKELTALKLRFFTDISHELRTPLTLIHSSIDEIQRKKQLTADGQENMQVAQRNVNRMLRLTNQILDFGKIQGQKMKVSIGSGELIAFCQQVHGNFAQLAHEHGIDYRFLHQQERIPCYTDWDKVEKILFNLLSNAFKYTAPGKKISLEASAEDKWFTLRVTNEGKEINAAQMKHIFERFETLGHKNPNRSTGIGLSLVKDYADLLHGKAQAESNPQQTTFAVTLPATCDAYATDPLAEFLPEDGIQFDPLTTEEAPGKQAEGNEAQAGETLLIVEDNDELRRFLSRLLAEKYRVLQAANGQQAFDMAKEKLPDLIVSDVMMPEMDGIQLVEAVKAHRDTSHIPIILLSAKSSVEDRIQGLEYGADDYLAKPFHSVYLKARIASLIKQRNSLAAYYLEQRKEDTKKESKPRKAAGEAPAQVPPFDDTFIRNVIQFVDEHLQDPQFTIDDLAETMHMSRTVFYRKIKTFTGASPIDLVRDMRIKRAATLLEEGECSLADVAYRSGFSSPQYFNRVFKEKMNCTPNEYRKKNAVGHSHTPRPSNGAESPDA